MNTFDAELAAESFRTLAESQRLRERAEEACRGCLYDYAAEHARGDCSPDAIEVRFDRIVLVVDGVVKGYPVIEVRLGLYADGPNTHVDGKLIPVGHFLYVTLLDGRMDDIEFTLNVRYEE